MREGSNVPTRLSVPDLNLTINRDQEEVLCNSITAQDLEFFRALSHSPADLESLPLLGRPGKHHRFGALDTTEQQFAVGMRLPEGTMSNTLRHVHMEILRKHGGAVPEAYYSNESILVVKRIDIAEVQVPPAIALAQLQELERVAFARAISHPLWRDALDYGKYVRIDANNLDNVVYDRHHQLVVLDPIFVWED